MDMCIAQPRSEKATDPKQLRQALGRFVTGVAIVSTVAPNGTSAACTVNSFSAVSLTPPLVLFSLVREKNSAAHFQPGQPFGVTVLSQAQRSVSNRFARSCGDKWDGIEFSTGHTGVPLVDGAAVCFEGMVEANHDGGDHIIVIGRVQHLHVGDDELEPLVFHRGRYTALC